MSEQVVLPKPTFEACDETSIRIKWDPVTLSNSNNKLKLQYMMAYLEWDKAVIVDVTSGSNNVDNSSSSSVGNSEYIVNVASMVDLEPGTPYYIRLVEVDSTNAIVNVGKETVLDTKPIDCTPKRKTCTIS